MVPCTSSTATPSADTASPIASSASMHRKRAPDRVARASAPRAQRQHGGFSSCAATLRLQPVIRGRLQDQVDQHRQRQRPAMRGALTSDNGLFSDASCLRTLIKMARFRFGRIEALPLTTWSGLDTIPASAPMHTLVGPCQRLK